MALVSLKIFHLELAGNAVYENKEIVAAFAASFRWA
jgi:hypothetical protein